VYSYFLDPLRHDSIKIFELGIAKGASLLAFADYFSNAKIVGLDINPDIVNRNLKLGVEGGGWELIKDLDRIDLREGDQSDENVLLDICQDYDNEFDIIIDDGSHATKDQLKSFDVLYKHVKSNGFYIIEDVHCDALKDDGLLNIFIENIKKNRIDDSKFCGIFYTNPDSLTIILQKK
jgi:cephalosporin hydroxylase